MFIKPTRSREKVIEGRNTTIMLCPYCQKEYAGSNPAGIFRHMCNGDELYFLNGFVFCDVPSYIYNEQKEKPHESTTNP